jgi:hypothetical protein
MATEKTALQAAAIAPGELDPADNPAGDLEAELKQLFALSRDNDYTTITVPTFKELHINCCE